MAWNYRVVEQDDGLGGRVLKIHTAYHMSDCASGVVITRDVDSISEEGASPFGEDIDELKLCLHRMLDALDKPILQYEDFEDE